MYKGKKVFDVHGHISTPPHFRAAAMNLIALRTAAESAAMPEPAVKQALERHLRMLDERNVDVQLVDLEWTLDRGKLILYVLNERGPECTKLAIQAAAAGFGLIEVQPVSKDGLVDLPKGGGCGSGGCD